MTKRFRSFYSVLAILLLNIVLLFVVIELVSAVLLNTVFREPSLAEEIEAFKERQLATDYYKSQEWARGYWDEHMEIVDHWDYRPWRIWRTRPANGEYININQAGLRVVPNTECNEDTFTILTFGGSTMWGYGAPDWGTIPAYLREQYENAGEAVCIINYAGVAYTSTQEVIQLLLLLQDDRVPDMVIFYDGANDVTTANRNGEAGTHFYYDQISEEIEGNVAFGSPEDEAQSPLLSVLQATNTSQLIQRFTQEEASEPGFSSPELAHEVVQTYLNNLEIVSSLADTYGFEFYAFWQPILLFEEANLTDEEQRALWEMPGNLPELFRLVYAEMETNAETNDILTYFGDLLGDETAPIWIDYNHVNPRGNEIVAEAIFEVISSE